MGRMSDEAIECGWTPDGSHWVAWPFQPFHETVQFVVLPASEIVTQLTV